MTKSADSGPENFRDQFCRKYRCAPESFERSVVRRCFPVLVRPLGAVLLTINPRLFQRELALVGRLGKAVNETGLRTELEGYGYENARDKSFRTESLGLRLSRRRFMRIFRGVMGYLRNQRNGTADAEPEVPSVDSEGD